MSHLDYFNDKDKAEIEKELQRLCKIRFERNKEFESANKKRNVITILGFALLFFLLICVFGKPTGIDILWGLLISFCASLFYYFINFSVFISWLATGDESETLLGEWLCDRGCRDSVVLATKVGFDRHGQGAGLKKEQIEYWVDESLRKLKTDYIDLYYAHTDDPTTPIDETMEAFDRLVKKGKVRTLGASNFDTWRMAEANMIANARGMTPYTVMQQRLSYLNPRFGVAPAYTYNEVTNRERLRFLCDKNMPLVSYACLCKGAYENPDLLPAEYESGKRLEFIRTMAKEKGVNPSALVIAWLTNLHRCEGFPRVIPLFSATPEQLLQNLQGLELLLTDEELKLMNSL